MTVPPLSCNQNSRVHVQPITCTRVTATFRGGFWAFLGGFRRVKAANAADKGGAKFVTSQKAGAVVMEKRLSARRVWQ